MKPTKNKVFCIDCGRTKQLFESEKKANNFIKFNSEEILEQGEKTPVRSYYCLSCGGWHVTSKTTTYDAPTRSERIINKIKEDNKIRQEVLKTYKKKIQDAKERICNIVNELQVDFENMKKECENISQREEKLKHINAFIKRLNEIRTTMALKKNQRKFIHNLEQESKQYYYSVKNTL